MPCRFIVCSRNALPTILYAWLRGYAARYLLCGWLHSAPVFTRISPNSHAGLRLSLILPKQVSQSSMQFSGFSSSRGCRQGCAKKTRLKHQQHRSKESNMACTVACRRAGKRKLRNRLRRKKNKGGRNHSLSHTSLVEGLNHPSGILGPQGSTDTSRLLRLLAQSILLFLPHVRVNQRSIGLVSLHRDETVRSCKPSPPPETVSISNRESGEDAP